MTSHSVRTIAASRMAYDESIEGKDLLTERIIGAAIEVHRHLGPGLLESTYEQCLCWEMRDAGLHFARQIMIPIKYRNDSVPAVYRPDILVENRVIIEIKAVDRIASVHESQLLTYMRHTGIHTGLLLNFNCPSCSKASSVSRSDSQRGATRSPPFPQFPLKKFSVVLGVLGDSVSS